MPALRNKKGDGGYLNTRLPWNLVEQIDAEREKPEHGRTRQKHLEFIIAQHFAKQKAAKPTSHR